MTNADKFRNVFGLYATELWSMPEKDFLKWLNSEAMNCSKFPNSSDLISRQATISLAGDLQIHGDEYHMYNQAINNYCAEIMGLPSAQPTYTDTEIQKMQDLESAEIEKAYQIGYEEGKKDAQPDLPIKEKCAYCPHCENCDVNDDLSIAQPERKKGHWIVVTRHEHYPSGKPYEQLRCPFCKRFDHNGDGNFCGYCGAELR